MCTHPFFIHDLDFISLASGKNGLAKGHACAGAILLDFHGNIIKWHSSFIHGYPQLRKREFIPDIWDHSG